MAEEQAQELEVLESIYPDELDKISDTEYTITLALDVPYQDETAEDFDPPKILLHVTYPPNYPDVAPELEVSLPSTSSIPHPIELDTDLQPIHEALNNAIQENLGMAMVFTLTSVLKDTAEGLIRGRVEAAEEIKAEIARKEEEKEMEKFRGEMVTKEVFEQWQKEFKLEREAKKAQEEKERDEADKGKKVGFGFSSAGKKMTGRELFEKGLAGGVEDDLNEDDVDLVEDDDDLPEVEKLKVGDT